MSPYNEARLQFIHNTEFSGERIKAEMAGLERRMETGRKKFRALSRETPPELVEYQQSITSYFSREYEQTTGERMDEPAVYFIPWKNREELRRLNLSFAGGRGIYDSDAHAVVILIDKTFTTRHLAMILAHELAHAYSKKAITLHAHSKGPKDFWSKNGVTVSKRQRGMVCISEDITIGQTLEEYYAAKREIQIAESEEFSRRFNDDLDSTVAAMRAMSSRGEWVPANSSHVRSVQTVGEHANLRLNGYHDLVLALDELFQVVPQGFELLQNARYSGKYDALQRAIDEVWGAGMFKYLMHGGTNYEFAHRTRALLKADTTIRTATLVTLTSFRDKKRKMGGVVEV